MIPKGVRLRCRVVVVSRIDLIEQGSYCSSVGAVSVTGAEAELYCHIYANTFGALSLGIVRSSSMSR